MSGKIIYTLTDEAPMLATHSFLPIVQAFASVAGVQVEVRDISLSGRVLALFPEYLTETQRISDDLAYLGELSLLPEANIIKLPNISASIPQLKATIKELQLKGYKLPEYPETPANETEVSVKARYDKVKGSAVNPVLREGNSDRRAPPSVKNYARKHPHKLSPWTAESKAHVSHMTHGDFYETETSTVIESDSTFRIELVSASGTKVLKPSTKILAGEVIDSAVMNTTALRTFLDEQIKDAKAKDVLFSAHLKATMMKVSDPILFGHVVKAYYGPVLDKHAAALKEIGFNPNNGIGDVYAKLHKASEESQKQITADIEALYSADRPQLAMVNSDKGITALHVPSDIIIDASMPAMIRDAGCMWNAAGNLQEAKAVIPDRCYAGIYQAVIDDCKKNGALNPVTMGTVPNVGLMAQAAEEYGSHDKTFEVEDAGVVNVIDNTSNAVLLTQKVNKGDIFRVCQAKDAAIRDWVQLAVTRSRASNTPAVFWLDPNRAHDAQIIKKVNTYLKDLDTTGLDIRVMDPVTAINFSLERIRKGEDTISVTGNVLRDYLTDLFPILELGTSAKMLSIVPLMAGGGLFETGAGGSAPKHVQQFVEDNFLRWDSLGEFMALSVSFEQLGTFAKNARATLLGKTLDKATELYLNDNRAPSRKVGAGIDNRGSHFYVAKYWADALAHQDEDSGLKKAMEGVSAILNDKEKVIVEELNSVQGKPVDIGGYYRPDLETLNKAMRPSKTLNEIVDKLFASCSA